VRGSGADKMYLYLIAKMPDQISEKRINIKFCVKLGKNASDTCALIMAEKL
jgi:hypothetical protein